MLPPRFWMPNGAKVSGIESAKPPGRLTGLKVLSKTSIFPLWKSVA